MSKKISDLQKKIAMSTVGKADIRGKEYSTVPLRIELFRKDIMASDVDDMPSIFTRVDMYEDRVVTRAYLAREVDVIIGEDGHEMVQMKGVKSVGTSEENRSASMINKTSAVENSETSAGKNAWDARITWRNHGIGRGNGSGLGFTKSSGDKASKS